MQKIRLILSFLERGISQRTIEKKVKISRKTIAFYLSKYHQSGVCFSDLLKQSDQQLEQLLGLIRTAVPEDTDPRKGGVPMSVKSDNMRHWVSKSCKYEPAFTEMLESWANHKNIALLAARPYKPKDKSSA
jgi:hypothetical protein